MQGANKWLRVHKSMVSEIWLTPNSLFMHFVFPFPQPPRMCYGPPQPEHHGSQMDSVLSSGSEQLTSADSLVCITTDQPHIWMSQMPREKEEWKAVVSVAPIVMLRVLGLQPH